MAPLINLGKLAHELELHSEVESDPMTLGALVAGSMMTVPRGQSVWQVGTPPRKGLVAGTQRLGKIFTLEPRPDNCENFV